MSNSETENRIRLEDELSAIRLDWSREITSTVQQKLIETLQKHLTQAALRRVDRILAPIREKAIEALVKELEGEAARLVDHYVDPILSEEEITIKINRPKELVCGYRVTALGLPQKTEDLLIRDGIITIFDLTAKTKNHLMLIPGFGHKRLRDVRQALSENGLHLAGDEPKGGEAK